MMIMDMNSIRILVVEDDIFIAQDIVEMLEQMDYEVAGVAYDATTALSHLERMAVSGRRNRTDPLPLMAGLKQ